MREIAETAHGQILPVDYIKTKDEILMFIMEEALAFISAHAKEIIVMELPRRSAAPDHGIPYGLHVETRTPYFDVIQAGAWGGNHTRIKRCVRVPGPDLRLDRGCIRDGDFREVDRAGGAPLITR